MKMTLKNPDEIKIFILFLLEELGIPMSFADLGTVVIRDGLVDYFAYFEYFCELVEAGHIVPVGEDGVSPVYDVIPMYGRVNLDGPEDAEHLEGDISNAFRRPSAEDLNNKKKLYTVTTTGRTIARSLSGNILMAAVREKSYESAMRHISFEKQGMECEQSFERDGDGFLFRCAIKDKDGSALDLTVRADTVYRLNQMRSTFDDRPDVVLRGVISLLTGNVNYLFDR